MKQFCIITSITMILLAIGLYMEIKTGGLVALTFLWSVVITIGVCSLRSGIFITCKPSKKIPGKIVLTIDDGPDPNFTPQLLALLRQYQLPATFFLIGKDAENYPEQVAAIVDAGHTIACHGYSHTSWSPWYLTYSWRREIVNSEKALGKYLQHKWFRPPFALMTPHMARVLKEKEYTTILIHVRALDFGNRRISNLAKRLLAKVEHGGVVMIHGKCPPATSAHTSQHVLDEFRRFFHAIANMKNITVLPLQDYLALD